MKRHAVHVQSGMADIQSRDYGHLPDPIWNLVKLDIALDQSSHELRGLWDLIFLRKSTLP